MTDFPSACDIAMIAATIATESAASCIPSTNARSILMVLTGRRLRYDMDERDAMARPRDLAQHFLDLRALVHQHALGDLDLEARRRNARLLDRHANEIGEGAAAELARRHVHRHALDRQALAAPFGHLR